MSFNKLESGSGSTQIPLGGLPEPKPKGFYHNIGPLKFESLVYPHDLGPSQFYPDCVCFTIQKRIGVSVDDVTQSFGAGKGEYDKAWKGIYTKAGIPDDIQKVLKKVKNEPDEKIRREKTQEAIDKYKKDHPDDHGLPEDMFDVIGKAIAGFGQAMRQAAKNVKALKMSKDGTNILGHIYLNMPNGIQFNEAAGWAGTELGFMGEAAKQVVSGEGELGETALGALAGGAGSMIGATVGALPSLVSKLGISGGMFGAAIGAMAAGSPIQKGFEAALGVAQNPYMEMMFSGVGFRKFQFEFILRPKSTKEVNTVAEILKMLRTFTKPTFTKGDLGKSFMDYPMQFQIEFLTSGGPPGEGQDFKMSGKAQPHDYAGYKLNPFVPKIKTSVCDNVTSNFTPQSIWAAHSSGSPVAVNLSLSFQETELVMAEDVYNDGQLGGY